MRDRRLQIPRALALEGWLWKDCGRFKKTWIDLFSAPSWDGRRIVEGCTLVPARQFVRTSGCSWALPGAVFSGLGGILGGLGGILGPLEGLLVSWGRLEIFVGRLGGVLGRLGGVLVGNMVPAWLPKRSPNR